MVSLGWLERDLPSPVLVRRFNERYSIISSNMCFRIPHVAAVCGRWERSLSVLLQARSHRQLPWSVQRQNSREPSCNGRELPSIHWEHRSMFRGRLVLCLRLRKDNLLKFRFSYWLYCRNWFAAWTSFRIPCGLYHRLKCRLILGTTWIVQCDWLRSLLPDRKPSRIDGTDCCGFYLKEIGNQHYD